VRDFLQILKVQVVKMKPELSVPLHGRSENDPGQTSVFRNRPPDKLPHPSSGTHFVLQKKAFCASANSQKRISCETSLKN
jgi:hypothetical protein